MKEFFLVEIDFHSESFLIEAKKRLTNFII